MKNIYCLIHAVVFLLIVGCGSDSDQKDDGFRSFDDFKNQVVDSIDDAAKECGVVKLGNDKTEANTCVAESFTNKEAFVAVYELQGIDSSVGIALAMQANLTVTLWRYDSNPCGGVPACPSKIEPVVCEDAQLSGVVDGQPEDIFICK